MIDPIKIQNRVETPKKVNETLDAASIASNFAPREAKEFRAAVKTIFTLPDLQEHEPKVIKEFMNKIIEEEYKKVVGK